MSAAERAQRRAELRDSYQQAKARELAAAGDAALAVEVLAGRCACGCHNPLKAPSVRTFYLDGHRQRRHRQRIQLAAEAAGVPTRLSLKALQAPSPTTGRNGDAPTQRNQPQRRRTSGPSIRISYRKAIDAVTAHLNRHGQEQLLARRQAEDILKPLLTPAQRTKMQSGRP